MKNIKSVLLLSSVLLLGLISANAQKKSADEIKKIVESQNYVFKAQMVNPQNMLSRQLTSEYDLTITKNAVISDLPYFGRAYVAPIDPTKGGIQFTSNKFDYSLSKDGERWKVMIKPKDHSDVQQMYLDIFENGRASLQVVSTNRQGISFDGYIEELKAEKKAF